MPVPTLVGQAVEITEASSDRQNRACASSSLSARFDFMAKTLPSCSPQQMRLHAEVVLLIDHETQRSAARSSPPRCRRPWAACSRLIR